VSDKVATDAATAAASALSQVATKAEATAVQALTNRVDAVENVNTSQSSSITELKNSVGVIQGSLGASGLDPAPGALWQFDSTVEGWSGTGATLTPGVGFVTVTSTGADPQFVSPAALALNGGIYTKIRMSITRRAGSSWDGQLFYSTAGHGFAAGYRKTIANPQLAIGASAVLEWDMANLSAGGTDWISSTIDRLRIDLGSTTADVFDIDWIAVGRSAPSASSRAVQSLDSKVTQQGSDLSAQAQQITGLQTSVGNNTASIQQVATSQSNTDGKINASYSVKLQLTANGQYAAAGFGTGIENNGGVLQSTFAVIADKFAILNPAGNGFVSPFAVQGGQVFLNEAFISQAAMQNAIVGNYLVSSQQSSWGGPVMSQNFVTGEIAIRHASRPNTYTVFNQGGVTVVVDGVVRVRMGTW